MISQSLEDNIKFDLNSLRGYIKVVIVFLVVLIINFILEYTLCHITI